MSRPHHITAVIYDSKGRVLSVGQNSFIKTHPVQAAHARKVGQAEKIFLHAEVHAIVRCKDISKAHRILISRWSEKGEPMLAAPCAICLSAIAETGIKVIQHT